PRVANAYTAKTNIGSYQIRNKYLMKKLEEEYDIQDMEGVWKSIVQHAGSVQHFDWMLDDDKEVFLTAYELDNNWIVAYACDRTEYVDQGTSTNLFLPADVNVKLLHKLHYDAWKGGAKSLYYLRSTSLNRASVRSEERECLSCQ
ncbi:MAG: ribonucleotide-diphosphate reductase subunit alpha, partial [Candidatus Desulfofervidaceae bacterium]|nr:ribonucleotide-diphosphate reductase subunit alpha [Candidatus Desulfofervidaceae bacterium]